MLYVRTFGEEDCIKYLVAKSARLAQFPQFGPQIMESAGQNVEPVNALRRDGVTLCPGLLPKTDVVKLAIQAAKGQLGRIRDHRREKDENRAIGDYLYLEQNKLTTGMYQHQLQEYFY